jgi:T-complex protein 1 subunit delta
MLLVLVICSRLVSVGIHPTTIAESFQKAATKSSEILAGMSVKLDLADRDSLLKSASTSLNSKVVSQYSGLLAPMAVDAVMHVIDPATATNVDLKDIRTVKKVGGTIDDTELVNGTVLTQSVLKSAGGPSRMEKAKIALIQFQLSPPKPDVSDAFVMGYVAVVTEIV